MGKQDAAMRIFFACPSSANNRVLPQSNIWWNNLADSLIHMECELVYPAYDIGQQYRDSYTILSNSTSSPIREEYSKQFVQSVCKAHREKPLNLVFTYFFSGHIAPWAIQEVRSLGVPTVNFYCNASHQFHLVAEIAPYFDFCMVPEKGALPKYRAIGAKPIHIQMAANPRIYKPYNLPTEYDVTFVGQKYLNRVQYLSYLYQHGIDVWVWGPWWRPEPEVIDQSLKRRAEAAILRIKRVVKHLMMGKALPMKRCGHSLSDEEMIKMYSRSRISLNFSEQIDNETGQTIRHIRLRDFEAPMSGALYFTGYQEELEEYYKIGKEIICYDTKEELLDKVCYYLKHETEARKIREAGLKRAQENHTWEKRFRQLFNTVGIV